MTMINSNVRSSSYYIEESCHTLSFTFFNISENYIFSQFFAFYASTLFTAVIRDLTKTVFVLCFPAIKAISNNSNNSNNNHHHHINNNNNAVFAI